MDDPILTLASNSLRRRQLLALAGWPYRPHPVDIDETPFPGEAADVYVLRLAEGKARAAGAEAPSARVILAADTTVADESGVMGKPVDAADAFAMLRRLRGRTHSVFTAVAVFCPADGAFFSGLCATRVWMRAYSEAQLAEYVASGDPLDKAGAYAVQHAGFHPVEKLEGCYANVIGLPLCLMQPLLERAGLPPRQRLPACPENYETCPICAGLARGNYAL